MTSKELKSITNELKMIGNDIQNTTDILELKNLREKLDIFVKKLLESKTILDDKMDDYKLHMSTKQKALNALKKATKIAEISLAYHIYLNADNNIKQLENIIENIIDGIDDMAYGIDVKIKKIETFRKNQERKN